MSTILSLPVHPLSKRILEAEYGPDLPLRIRANDILFSMLTHTQLRDRSSLVRTADLLTAETQFELDDALARHIERRCYQAGRHLFRWHKDLICRYVDTCLRRGMTARGALVEFYDLHQVTEDDFSLESAWKMWQRHNRESNRKNPVFSTGIRGATAVKNCKEITRRRKVKTALPVERIDDMSARLVDVLQGCLRAVPKKTHAHLRCYLYKRYSGLSEEQMCRRLHRSPRGLYYGAAVIRTWKATDATFRRLLEQIVDLP